MTSTSLRERLAATIASYKRLFYRNAQARRNAEIWHSVQHCEKHTTSCFYDLKKVQAGLPEEECFTCNLCELEARRNQPSPKSLNERPDYDAGKLAALFHQEEINRIVQAALPPPAQPEIVDATPEPLPTTDAIDLTAIKTVILQPQANPVLHIDQLATLKPLRANWPASWDFNTVGDTEHGMPALTRLRLESMYK